MAAAYSVYFISTFSRKYVTFSPILYFLLILQKHIDIQYYISYSITINQYYMSYNIVKDYNVT